MTAHTGLTAPYDAPRFLEHAHHVHGVPITALDCTRSVKGESGSVTWLLPDDRPWLHVVPK